MVKYCFRTYSPKTQRISSRMPTDKSEKSVLCDDRSFNSFSRDAAIGRADLGDCESCTFVCFKLQFVRARIRGVHDAVVRGNLGEVESVLTRKRFALSRDHLGASPLHLAVLHGHTDIVKYIIDNFPEALDGPDNNSII
ncbi:UNVERIFIED_CONTAM: hypothetical protein NCL1_45285 [Trichonephila clavipes]